MRVKIKKALQGDKFEGPAFLETDEISMRMERADTGYLRLYGNFGMYESVVCVTTAFLEEIIEKSKHITYFDFIDLSTYVFERGKGPY